MATNKDPFEKWNDPFFKDDLFAPWNDPLKKDDSFACWNDSFGQGDYREEVDRYPNR